MYSVTKRLDFCYGHRLLDYDGVCKHPHGHNAVVELEIQTETLDRRNMVADFTDIMRTMKGWIDRELDHRMILRHDDPLVLSLKSLGEPVYILDSNPTVERIARLLFDISREQGLPVSRAHLRWLNPMPANLGAVLARFDQVLVPEMNTGQLAFLLRGRYLKDVVSYGKVQGRPFFRSEIHERIRAILGETARVH